MKLNPGLPPVDPPSSPPPLAASEPALQTGWASWLARASMATLLFLAVSGLAIPFAPFHPAVQWGVLAHTALGALTLLPLGWYMMRHVADYRRYAASHITLLGWVAVAGLFIVSVSGAVLMIEAMVGVRTTPFWRRVHLLSTFVMLGGVMPHLAAVMVKQWTTRFTAGAAGYWMWGMAGAVGLLAVGGVMTWSYRGSDYANVFPDDYSYLYGTNRPFAPSLARTDTGGAFDARSLAGSRSCGTAGCHEQIVEEWLPSAHRYAAMDTVFLGIQEVMAKQNGPESTRYCAACHKQFIDAEVNRVGWVQLQNQYDNWAASHWNQQGDPLKTVECRECHMPLVESRDPASGDALDYNRAPRDGKHRSHRFIAANTLMPVALKDQLEGWETQLELTEQWLRGEFEIPEIQDKWSHGPIVKLVASAPEAVAVGQNIPLRVVMASNKVGHDFPTGPLDIIQSWLEITVVDDTGRTIWTSGKRDERHFLEPGTFLFKAEPVDQHGNLIDRHNLWEMVGVRFRRALFPGYSDSVQFDVPCSGAMSAAVTGAPGGAGNGSAGGLADGSLVIPTPPVIAPAVAGEYRIDVALNYRKVDQFLLNYLFGETNTLTAPVTEIARTTIRVKVQAEPGAASL